MKLFASTVQAFPSLKVNLTQEKKKRYWKGRRCLGVLAKLAQSKWEKVPGLSAPKKFTLKKKKRLFKKLLRLKFSANTELSRLLLSTGNVALVEQCRGALRRELILQKDPERWGGVCKQAPAGMWDIYGDNVMGKLLEHIRYKDNVMSKWLNQLLQ